MNRYRFDLRFYARDTLFDSKLSERVRATIAGLLPAWGKGAHVYSSSADTRPLDLDVRGAFSVVIEAALERGPDYARLVQSYGRPSYQRAHGYVEVRGSDESVILVLHLDAWPFSPRRGDATFGNWITFQVCREIVEGVAAHEWARHAAVPVLSAVPCFYATGYATAEHDAYNIDRSKGVRAVGKAINRYLPGLYWLNFFGKECGLFRRSCGSGISWRHA